MCRPLDSVVLWYCIIYILELFRVVSVCVSMCVCVCVCVCKEPAAEECSGAGTLVCGVCQCEEGRYIILCIMCDANFILSSSILL